MYLVFSFKDRTIEDKELLYTNLYLGFKYCFLSEEVSWRSQTINTVILLSKHLWCLGYSLFTGTGKISVQGYTVHWAEIPQKFVEAEFCL